MYCIFCVLGQSDIKKLRRENEQLRREIWGLRDEYDKLEEILRKRALDEEDEFGEYEDEQYTNQMQIVRTHFILYAKNNLFRNIFNQSALRFYIKIVCYKVWVLPILGLGLKVVVSRQL